MECVTLEICMAVFLFISECYFNFHKDSFEWKISFSWKCLRGQWPWCRGVEKSLHCCRSGQITLALVLKVNSHLNLCTLLFGFHNSGHFAVVYSSIIFNKPLWSSGSMLDHRSLPPLFESQCGNIWQLFNLWLCFITFGGCLAHLAHVHKSGPKILVAYIY